MATVIASQALISGAYSLTAQAIKLGYFPRLRIDHTSERHAGQIYVPAVNWLLMVASIGLVIGFRTSSNLAAAYGVGVATDMVITTLLLSLVMRDRWKWTVRSVLTVTASFLVVDLIFFGANITKVPAGGWFPILIGLLGFTLMTTWKTGRELVARQLHHTSVPAKKFIESIAKKPPERVEGTGVYLFREAGITPPTLLNNLRHHEVLHETIVLVSVEFAGRPRIPRAQRDRIESLGDRFFQVVLTYGFMDKTDVRTDLENIVSPEFGFDPIRATYFLGKETVRATEIPGMQMWRERLFVLMHRNATSAAESFNLPPDSTVEVGVQVPI
jgi:KUP system potassium uptake protein